MHLVLCIKLQFSQHRQPMLPKRSLISLQLTVRTEGMRIRQKQNPPPPRFDQTGHGVICRHFICTVHGIDILSFKFPVDQKDRDPLRRIYNVIYRITFLSLSGISGSHQYKCIDPFLHYQFQRLLFLLLLISTAIEDTVVIIFSQPVLQKRDCTGHIGIRHIRADNPDGLHGIQPQSSGKYVGRIVILLHDRPYLLFCFLADSGAVIHYPGYRSDRHSRQFCYIINIHAIFPPAINLVTTYIYFIIM